MRELFRDMYTTGLKTAYQIPPKGGCLQLLNADLDEQGGAKRRKGRERIFDSLGNGGIKGLHEYNGDLYTFWEGKMYKKGTDSWGSPIINTLASVDIRPTNYRTKFYFGDGTKIYESDGTTCAEITPYTPQTGEPANLLADANSPLHKCKYFAVHWWNMLIATGSPDAPDTVYVSALQKPDYFPASTAGSYYNSVYKLPEKDHTIQNVAIFYDVVVIFTDKGIFGIFGDGPGAYATRPINEQYGCIAPDSVALVENAVWFFSHDGVRKLESVSSVEKYFNVSLVSKDITPTIEKINDKSSAVAIYANGQYRLSFPNDNTTLRCYPNHIDPATGQPAWTMDTNCCSCYAKVGDTLYSASPTQGVVWEEGKGLTDDGSPYVYRVLKHFGTGDLAKIKKTVLFYRTHQTMAHLTLNITADEYKTSKQSASAKLTLPSDSRSVLGEWILGVSKLGSSPNTPSRELKTKVEGHYFIIDITGNEAEDFEIVGYKVYGRFKKNKARKDGVTVG